MSKEEVTGGSVVELAPIVTLNAFDGVPKLRCNIGEEIGEDGERLGFEANGKSPRKV